MSTTTQWSLQSQNSTGSQVAASSISLESGFIAAASGKKVLLWNLEQPESIITIPYTNTIASLALSADGKWLSISMVYRGCFVQVFAVEDIIAFSRSSNSAATVEFGPDAEKQLFEPVVTLTKKFSDCVKSISFSPDGSLLGLSGHEAEVGVLCLDSKKIVEFWEPYSPATAVAISSKNKWIAYGSGTSEGRLVVNAIDTGKQKINSNIGRGAKVQCLDFAPDKKSIVVACRNRTLHRWKMTRKTPTYSATLSSRANRLQHGADGERIFAGLENGSVAVIDSESGDTIESVQAHDAPICGLAVSDNTLVTVSTFGQYAMWHQP